MVKRETYWGVWFESRLSDWWFDESVDQGHQSRLNNDYGADMAHCRRIFMDFVFSDEARLAEGRGRPGYEDSDKRGIQGDLFKILSARYSLGVPMDQLVAGFHELVKVIGEDELISQVDGLWIFAWAAMVGDQGAKDTLKRVAPLANLPQHPSFLADVFLGVEPISDLPYWDTPKGKLFHTELNKAYELAMAGDRESATKVHNGYAANEWLKLHRGAHWYGTHKTGTFIGYWSFESAALAKVAGIDDSALEGNDNYPYELAHYTP